jgi:Cysteine dioxygenase type I
VTIVPWRTAKLTWSSTRQRSLEPVDLLAVARGFARSATSWPGMDDPCVRCWRTIAANDRFEAWVVAWPVGGEIELHDHGGSAGAVSVASGTLIETSIRPDDDGELVAASMAIHTDDHLVFGPEHVHDLVNRGPGPALSIHVYSPALRSMTYFDWTDQRRLVAIRTDEYSEGLLVG